MKYRVSLLLSGPGVVPDPPNEWGNHWSLRGSPRHPFEVWLQKMGCVGLVGEVWWVSRA